MKIKTVKLIFSFPALIVFFIFYIKLLYHVKASEALWILFWVYVFFSIVFRLVEAVEEG